MHRARPTHAWMPALAIGLALALSALPPAPAHAQSPLGAANTTPWSQLSKAQKAALQPLATQWGSLPADHQQKWLAVAAQYPQLAPQEQARMQQRMTHWAAMSRSEREQTRRNFDAAREATSTQERKAKWDAYQNLGENERKALIPAPPPSAPAVHPPTRASERSLGGKP